MGFRLGNVHGRAVLVEGDDWYDLATVAGGREELSDPMVALGQPAVLHEVADRLAGQAPGGRVADVVLGPPVPRPQKVFGVGLNYLGHAEESKMELPTSPLVFAKFSSCIVGPTAEVHLRSERCDYEGELVVVIGPGGSDIAVDDAWNHVVGLTVGQDVSDRAMQFAAKPPHFDLGKSFDTFGPIGPLMVSPDVVADRNDLRLTVAVNGEARQDDTTAHLIFDVPTLVSYLSHITTLVPGDLIFTGTPSGVGYALRKLLRDGDVIETTIDGIGTMTNRCVRVADHGRL